MIEISPSDGRHASFGDIDIRGLRSSDEAAVRYISCETAFLGEPIRGVLDCLDLVADLLTYYYIHFEAGSCFLAEDEDQDKVVGYILGAVDTKSSNRIMVSRVYPLVLKQFILGRYKIGKTEVAHGWRLLLSALRGEIPKPDLVEYPAHLHINILKPYRRRGIGTELMARYQDDLVERGVRGVHLLTTNMHKEAVPFYERLGFQLCARIESKMWRKIFGRIRVENRLFVKPLA